MEAIPRLRGTLSIASPTRPHWMHGKFARGSQIDRGSEQILYSPESYWFGDVVGGWFI